MEIYESLSSITMNETTITMNIGPTLESEGWIDFYIHTPAEKNQQRGNLHLLSIHKILILFTW